MKTIIMICVLSAIGITILVILLQRRCFYAAYMAYVNLQECKVSLTKQEICALYHANPDKWVWDSVLDCLYYCVTEDSPLLPIKIEHRYYIIMDKHTYFWMYEQYHAWLQHRLDIKSWQYKELMLKDIQKDIDKMKEEAQREIESAWFQIGEIATRLSKEDNNET